MFLISMEGLWGLYIICVDAIWQEIIIKTEPSSVSKIYVCLNNAYYGKIVCVLEELPS